MLEWMREKKLLKYVSYVMVVSVFWIIYNGKNGKITYLTLCIKKEKIINNYFLHVLVN